MLVITLSDEVLGTLSENNLRRTTIGIRSSSTVDELSYTSSAATSFPGPLIFPLQKAERLEKLGMRLHPLLTCTANQPILISPFDG